MKKSIGQKIFIYMIIFSLAIVGMIGFGIKFLFPTYYENSQMKYLDKSEALIRAQYAMEDYESVLETMTLIEEELGGELYYFTETSGMQGVSMGKGRNKTVITNTEKFIPTGEITTYEYINKIGLDIHVIGVLVSDEYLVYEVSIQNLSQATGTMINFIWALLFIVIVLAFIISFFLSRNISKPIKALNVLAEAMKNKNIEPYLVTEEKNEINQLNQTLNELYEELLSSIYKLNAELNKERNAEQLKKRFLAQATHELKTPIAVIRGYSEILYDGMYKNEEEHDKFLKNIYEETEAVSHLILDVLDYTKMETGNYQLNKVNKPVKRHIQELLKRYKDYVESYNLKFELVDKIPEDFEKSMDWNKFDQIYKNLISNAVEHGQTLVRTKIQVINSKIRMSVYNDGSHIDEEDIANVFESFYKKKGKKTGTGLGLAIVKEIVLLHGGDYRVENTEDGVEFFISV
ncbi:MAG: HAMP domain-containing histidine kinase [Clostridia bacterium]|nr:HAMP domain-containing histidine kinase [Clostridia bacterium]